MIHANLAALYADESRLRAVIEAVLEGRVGDALVDATTRPRAACLKLGCYAIFAGDPEAARVSELLAALQAPIELIIPRSPEWLQLLQARYGRRLVQRPMQAYRPDQIDCERLCALAASIPAGYRLARLDAGLAQQLGPRLRPNGREVLEQPQAFAEMAGGVGLVAGGVLASAATSYAFSARSIELAIATDPDHRGRGLATCAAAEWTRICLERGITPHWNASNPVSQRLALRLGYRPAEVVEVWFLPDRVA